MKIALPALPVLEAQGDVALVGEREAPDARLLVRSELAGKVAKAFEHALQLLAAALPVIGGEELLRVFFVVFGELALERRELRRRERREHRCRVFRRLRGERAVTDAHGGQAPREAPDRE